MGSWSGLWRQLRRQQEATKLSDVPDASADAPSSSAVASSTDIAPTEGESVGGGMPSGLTKMQQVAWKNREKLNAVSCCTRV